MIRKICFVFYVFQIVLRRICLVIHSYLSPACQQSLSYKVKERTFSQGALSHKILRMNNLIFSAISWLQNRLFFSVLKLVFNVFYYSMVKPVDYLTVVSWEVPAQIFFMFLTNFFQLFWWGYRKSEQDGFGTGFKILEISKVITEARVPNIIEKLKK